MSLESCSDSSDALNTAEECMAGVEQPGNAASKESSQNISANIALFRAGS